MLTWVCRTMSQTQLQNVPGSNNIRNQHFVIVITRPSTNQMEVPRQGSRDGGAGGGCGTFAAEHQVGNLRVRESFLVHIQRGPDVAHSHRLTQGAELDALQTLVELLCGHRRALRLLQLLLDATDLANALQRREQEGTAASTSTAAMPT